MWNRIFFTAHKCPLEWDEGLQINIKEYQDLERNNSDKKQKEVVVVTWQLRKWCRRLQTLLYLLWNTCGSLGGVHIRGVMTSTLLLPKWLGTSRTFQRLWISTHRTSWIALLALMRSRLWWFFLSFRNIEVSLIGADWHTLKDLFGILALISGLVAITLCPTITTFILSVSRGLSFI